MKMNYEDEDMLLEYWLEKHRDQEYVTGGW